MPFVSSTLQGGIGKPHSFRPTRPATCSGLCGVRTLPDITVPVLRQAIFRREGGAAQPIRNGDAVVALVAAIRSMNENSSTRKALNAALPADSGFLERDAALGL